MSTASEHPTPEQVEHFIRECIADVYQQFPPLPGYEFLAEVAVNTLRRKGALTIPEVRA